MSNVPKPPDIGVDARVRPRQRQSAQAACPPVLDVDRGVGAGGEGDRDVRRGEPRAVAQRLEALARPADVDGLDLA
jgi:hypothetical protein